MSWRFVGRAEQLGRLRAVVEGAEHGPLVITGEPGMGRTALINEALRQASTPASRTIRMRATGTAPFSSLRESFPGLLPATVTSHDEAARMLAARAGGERMVIAADDAHLMDHASMLALRALSRAGHAAILASRPLSAGSAVRPDPTLCLAYENDSRTIMLPPLSPAEVATIAGHVVGGAVGLAAADALHAVAGGNPRVLRGLLVDGRLTESMEPRQGGWRFVAVRRWARAHAGADQGAPGLSGTRLAEAIGGAWQELAIEKLDQLCRIALWCGAPDLVAVAWPFLLFLRGSPEQALAFIDSLGAAAPEARPHLALVKAMALALGTGQRDVASEYLRVMAGNGIGAQGLLSAFRAWLLAAGGKAREASSALRAIEPGNRETALFVHAARAGVTRASGNAADTVFHLRRALATAECCRDACPWMWPYLSACLADALAEAGRAGEASSATARPRAQMSASGRYVGDILHALVLDYERELTDRPADEPLALAGADRLVPEMAMTSAGQRDSRRTSTYRAKGGWGTGPAWRRVPDCQWPL